jgi:hypothetical protein
MWHIHRPPESLPSDAVEACIAAQMQAMLWALNWRVYIPSADLEGVDWLTATPTGEYRKVQQKTSFTIDRKYQGKNLWIAFPHRFANEQEHFGFYLVPHDGEAGLMGFAEQRGHLKSPSWSKGNYHYAPWGYHWGLTEFLNAHGYRIQPP